jgi:RNA polymerase sigma-70 factor (ECF subfamily)
MSLLKVHIDEPASMMEPPATVQLAAARTGDQMAFQRLIEPYQRELLVHCYRILGSWEDAEDIVQETWLRAWRRLDSFAERASLRAWLYKIATHAALDVLGSRRRRHLPALSHAPATPGDPWPAPLHESFWLEPLPDTLVDESLAFNPEARYEARESVTLAFLAALQRLPGRQRAVLILRDVLGWHAGEVAELLNTTVAAANSALQRARATMQQYHSRPAPPADTPTAALLARYVAAWEAADAKALVALLHEDAVLTMPPLPLWYRGRDAIRWFLDTHLFTRPERGEFRLRATQANGSPAFTAYQRDAGGVYRASALQVLTLADGAITEIHDFLAPGAQVLSRFGLPPVL